MEPVPATDRASKQESVSRPGRRWWFVCFVLAILVFVAALIFTPPPTPPYGFLQDAKRVKLEMEIVPHTVVGGREILVQRTTYNSLLSIHQLKAVVESEMHLPGWSTLSFGARTIHFFDFKGESVSLEDDGEYVRISVSETRTPTILDRVRVWVMERMPSRSSAPDDSTKFQLHRLP